MTTDQHTPAATDLATLSIAGRVVRLTINRPEQRNSLSVDLLAALHARLDELDAHLRAHEDITVLALTGAGPAFCAGMDLKQVIIDTGDGVGSPADLPRRLLGELGRLTLRLRAVPCVTVALVNGPAIGGGCGLVTVCDIAATHAKCKLGFPEVDLGLCPAVVAPWLARKVGPGRARRILLLGGVLSGTEAFDAGIVDFCEVDPAALAARGEALLAHLAEGGPRALAATKALLNRLDGSDDAALIERGADLSASVLATAEAQAQLRARLK